MKRVFKLPTNRGRISKDVEAELQFHLEGRVEELMATEGMSRDAAEREARRRFGDYDTYRQEANAIDRGMARRKNAVELFHSAVREARTALRSLGRSPSFSIISIITLALGLGAATTIFTLLDRVVLRPMPYPNANRLVALATAWPKLKAGTEFGISRGQYFYLKQNSQLIEDVVFYDVDMEVLDGDGSKPPERVSTIQTSASAFPMLGIRPIVGQPLSASDELRPDGKPGVALLSYEFWQRRFGGDRGVVGRTIHLNDGMPLEIIGILPPGTAMPNAVGDIWYRDHLNPADPPQNNHTHFGIALAKRGVTAAAVQTEVQQLQDRFARANPNVYSPNFVKRTGFSMRARWLRDQVVGSTVVRALWLVFAAVAFVLLIAGANVANLFLIRIDARRREIALRRALGADNVHIALYTLGETLCLAGLAGLLAIGIGFGLLKLVLLIAPQSLPRLAEVGFDWRSVTFCLGASLAFGVAFGLLPIASPTTDNAVLRDGSRGLTRSRVRENVRRALVLTEVALAVVLLAGAGLMLKTFARLRAEPAGFDATGVHTMLINAASHIPKKSSEVERFWHDLVTRVEAIPGVSRAGAGSSLPLVAGDGCSGLLFDVTNSAGESGNCMPWDIVTPGYLEVFGIKVRGQSPTWESVEAHAAPVVVTKAFGDRFWEASDPIGHWMKPFNPTMSQFTIVGVSDDMHFTGIQQPVSQRAFFPLLASTDTSSFRIGSALTLVIKAPTLSSGALATQVRAILAQIEPKAVVADVTPMETLVARSMAQTSFTMLLLLVAASIALILSAVGLYGVVSYIVNQRRGEIGVRRALGAQVSDVTRLVVGQSIALASVGSLAGVVAAIGATRLLRALLFNVSPLDPLVLGGTVLVLLIVATIASVAPALRAARIDPVEAMRA